MLSLLTKPLFTLAIFPLPLFLRAVLCVEEDTNSMLHVVFPTAHILIAIRENHSALAVFLVGLEVASINSAVLEGQLALAFKLVLHKVTLVSPLTLGCVVNSVAIKLTVLKHAFVERPVGPIVLAFSLLAPLNVVAFKFYFSLAPGLFAEAVLKVIYPIPFISRALSVNKYSYAVGHVVLPLSLVDITVCLGHLSSALHLIFFELTLVI